MAQLLSSSSRYPCGILRKQVQFSSLQNKYSNDNRAFGSIRDWNFKLRCCTSTGTSENEVGVLSRIGQDEQENYLVESDGWKVRRLSKDEDEMKSVAFIQAEAFYTPVAMFDHLFFQFFQAEVHSGLLYKLKNSPPNRYACLVAEPNSNESMSMKSRKKLVGVVDVTVLRDTDVKQHLLGAADEYLYISGLAVSKRFRRRKIGSALLKACEMLAAIWGYEYLVLRAYEDDLGARRLYSNAGYQVVSADPPWISSWIGRKRRVLMVKRSNYNLLS